MHTAHLLLRPLTADDADAYWPLVSHPDILRYTGEKPMESVEQVRQMLLERPIRDYGLHYTAMAAWPASKRHQGGWSVSAD